MAANRGTADFITSSPATAGFTAERSLEFVRFNLSQRIEHLLMIISFTTLMVTGIPQKFHEAAWAGNAMALMGGIENVRTIHHFAAVLFVLEGIYHVLYLAYAVIVKRVRWTMMPVPKDVRDVIHMLLYFVGRTKTQPKFDRYDFRQKFEYFGVVWGGVVMIVTGFVMWFPVQATRFIPGEFVPAAKAAHGGEALLALLVIVIWHFYGAHFNEHTMPFDKSIFTGKISAKRMLEEHPLEYEHLTGRKAEDLLAEIEGERGHGRVG